MRLQYTPTARTSAITAQKLNSRLGIRTSVWTSLYSYFVALHMIIVPALLLFFGQYLLGGLSFALVVVVSLLYQSKGQLDNFESFYRQVLGDSPDQVDLVLNSDGVHTSYRDCSAFYPWGSIVEIESDDIVTIFFSKDAALTIPNTAFSSAEQRQGFVEFSRANIAQAGDVKCLS